MSNQTAPFLLEEAGIRSEIKSALFAVAMYPTRHLGQPETLEPVVDRILRATGRRGEVCSVCAGTGQPISGRPCICGGRGTLRAEADGLRRALYEARGNG